jgi:gas vesicle protein
MSAVKSFLGVLGGVASGLLLGFFLAPGKNVAERKRIFKEGKDFARDSKDRLNDFIDGIAGNHEVAEVQKGK